MKDRYNVSPEALYKLKEVAQKTLFYFLIVVIAVFSAYCTYNLAITNFHNVFMAYMVTILVEGCLTAFSILYNTKSKSYFLLWIAYLAFSILASQGSIIGDLDAKKSDSIHNSAEYTKYIQDCKDIDAQIATYNVRLNALNGAGATTDNSAAINDLNSQISAKRNELKNTLSKYARVRTDIEKEIASLEDSKQQLLDKDAKSNELKAGSTTEANNIRTEISKLISRKDALKVQLDKDLATFSVGENAFDKTLKAFNISEVKFWTMFFILLEISRFALIKALRGGFEISFFTKIKNTVMDYLGNGSCEPYQPEQVNDKPKIGFGSAYYPNRNQNMSYNSNSCEGDCDYCDNDYCQNRIMTPKPKSKIGFDTSSKRNAENLSSTKFDDGSKIESDYSRHLERSNIAKNLSPTNFDNRSDFSKADVLRYLNYMYSHIKHGNKSVGVKKIWENVGNGCTLDEFRKIHGHLTNLGIVRTHGGTDTIILCAQNEALKRV